MGEALEVSADRLRVDDYPIGTKVHALGGGHWTRVAGGWQANGGSTFPTYGGDASWVELPGSASMTFERADEIVKRINQRAFFVMGIGDMKCEPLDGVSLGEMLEAVAVLEAAGPQDNGDGTRTMRVKPAERLIAAVYVLENYEPGNAAVVARPTRQWPFDRRALAVFGIEPGQGNEEEE